MTSNWWKEAVAYHIYPRSFQDTNGDGIGDLPGIIQRLDHLQQLGVTLVMLGPIYPTPNDDNGYDISDYTGINPEFGSMADFEALVEGLHSRGMRLMLDLVLNHSSDEHPWFVESRSSKDNPYRDFYHWRPARDGGVPNNWQSVFSGSVWEWDEKTQEYYLHLYSRKQPDLNWDNPEVRRRLHDVVSFWTDKGADGFRLDTITTIAKVEGLPDAPITVDGPYQPAHTLIFNGPGIHDHLAELRRASVDGHDLVIVGEGPGVDVEHARQYLDAKTGSMNMLFQWEHIEADPGSGGKWLADSWTPAQFREVMTRWQHGLNGAGWNTLYMSNHDQPRPVSRFGDDGAYRTQSAKMLATALYLLQGTPFIYQGEEIGMTNAVFDSIGDYRDLESLNYYEERIAAGDDPADVLERVQRKSRDNGRTPVQWNSSHAAGFTTGTPWIDVTRNAREVNVEREAADPASVLNYYRDLFRLRRGLPVAVYGSYRDVTGTDPSVYAYVREDDDSILHVVCNFSGDNRAYDAGSAGVQGAQEVILSNYADRFATSDDLRPYESFVTLTRKNS